jgi:hypothetical protein
MKDGRHNVALQLLTPRKLPIGYGASGTHKGSSCKF